MNPPVLAPLIRSQVLPPAMPSPNGWPSTGMRLALARSVPLVPQTPSSRERWSWPPSSSVMPSLTTQAGEVTAMKSLLAAADAHDSTLQSPGLPTSASSTTNAPPAAFACIGSRTVTATSINAAILSHRNAACLGANEGRDQQVRRIGANKGVSVRCQAAALAIQAEDSARQSRQSREPG